MKKIDNNYTRTIHPAFGLLGLSGFLGVLGFLPIYENTSLGIPFPFLFFCFFGFFGFYYEGKMSHTLKDERYQFNAYKADSFASKTALTVVFLTTIFATSLFRIHNPYLMVSVLYCTVGLAFGGCIFLSQYLLYRYDCEE